MGQIIRRQRDRRRTQIFNKPFRPRRAGNGRNPRLLRQNPSQRDLRRGGPFGGGHGEEMFRSLLTDSMAKEMTKAGGIGLADTVQREILKLQGLT